jgi:hypothetical protein
MQRRTSRQATVLITAVAASVLTASGSASAGPAARDPAISADLTRRLESIGVDSSSAVFQHGLRNYSGPDCPGRRWTCTSTNVPVVQIADSGTAARNVGECAPGSNECVIVQIGTSGENLADCIEETDQPVGVVEQSCEIIQVNVLGTNTAVVRQAIRQMAIGAAQDARQTATLVQKNGSGPNLVTIGQQIDQSAKNQVASGTAIDQTQEGHQFTSVDQTTETGSNSSNVEQFLSESLEATLSTSMPKDSSVTQKQNAFDAGPNTQARIDQQSDPTNGGTNTSSLLQENRLEAEARADSIDQAQGSLSGGLDGFVKQSSSGLSTSTNRQDEVQLATATVADVVSQTQHGPARCCTTQFNNRDNIFDIVQTTTQMASDPDALQTNELRGSCITSGICTINQTVNLNGASVTGGCSGAACFPFILCPPPAGTPGDPCAVGIRRASWNRPR